MKPSTPHGASTGRPGAREVYRRRRVIVNIFEGTDPDPVLSHVAYGGTYEEAERIIRVHAKYDSFLRAALEGRDFKGIALRTEILHG